MGKIGHLRVLIIDDTQTGAFVTSELLNDEILDARDISIAKSPLSAMFQFGSEKYDLVICNADLDTMSGMKLVNLVRSGGISVPFILLRDSESYDEEVDSDPMVISVLDRKALAAEKILFAAQDHIDGSKSGSNAQQQHAEAW